MKGAFPDKNETVEEIQQFLLDYLQSPKPKRRDVLVRLKILVEQESARDNLPLHACNSSKKFSLSSGDICGVCTGKGVNLVGGIRSFTTTRIGERWKG